MKYNNNEVNNIKFNGADINVLKLNGVEVWRKVTPPPLPEGYVEVEYIESTGTQYIKSNVISNTVKRSKIKLKYTNINTQAVIASRKANDRFLLCYVENNKYCIGYGNYWTFGTVSDDTICVETLLQNKEQKCWIDNILSYSNNYEYTLNNDLELYLFARNNIDTKDMPSKCKVYYIMLYDQYDSLIRNFIPCINPSNKVGMYDTVTQTFFGNSGTGEFIAGPPVN